MINKIKLILLLTIITIFNLPIAASAKPPVVVEFFGKNNCKKDTVAQKFLQETLANHDDVILIACRIRYDETEKQKAENKKFSHKFCTERFRDFTNLFKKNYSIAPTAMIVNGHLDANYEDVMPAINYGRTDNIKSISLSLNDNMLDIKIPEVKSEVKTGEIVLYVYNQTSSEVIPPPEQYKDAPAKTQLYLRPILSIETIGKWSDNKQIEMNYPLEEIKSLAGKNYNDFGYIVTVREKDSYGKILAAGEIIPETEKLNSLPHSEPAIAVPTTTDEKTEKEEETLSE